MCDVVLSGKPRLWYDWSRRGEDENQPAQAQWSDVISRAQIPQCDYVCERWLIAKVIARMIRRGEKLDPVHVLRVMYQPGYRNLIRLASLNLSRKCGDAFSDAYKAEVTVLEEILTKTTSGRQSKASQAPQSVSTSKGGYL